MYISENNTLKLRLCDGAAVHIKDEYIIKIIFGYYFADVADKKKLSIPHVLKPGGIKIIDSNSKVLKNLKERFLRRNICCTML